MSDLVFDIAVQATVAAAIKEFVDLNKELDSLKNSLTATLGSSEAAGAALEHIAGLAERTGQGVMELSRQYSQMAAAAKGTALEGAGLYDVFDTVSASMGQLGKSSAETERAMTALTQMMSKGVVAAEEWRGQLGESMPNANAALQKATGLTTAEINKLMESGSLLAVDVLPALSLGLKQLGVDSTKHVDTLQASLTRLQNTTQGLFTSLGDAGATAKFKGLVDDIDLGLRGLQAAASDTRTAVGPLFEQLSQAEKFTPTSLALTYLKDALKGYVTEHEKAPAAINATAEAISRLAAQTITASAASAQAADNAAKNAAATEAAGKAAQAAADANLALARLSGDATAILQAQAQAAQAAAKATQDNADAKSKELAAAQSSITVMRESIAQLELEKEANAGSADEIDKMIEAKQAEIDKREQAIGKTSEEAKALASTAEAQRLEAEQATIAAETYGDQSAKLGSLTAEYSRAATAVKALQRAQDDGKQAALALGDAQAALDAITARYTEAMEDAAAGNRDAASAINDLGRQQQAALAVVEGLRAKVQAGAQADKDAATAKERLAIASAKVKDAQQDLIDRTDESLRQAERETSHLQTQGSQRAESIRLLEQEAKTRGDTVAATQAEVEALQAEAQTIKQQIAAKQDELAIAQQLYQQKLTQAQQDGTVTAQEQAQLDTAKDLVATKRDELNALQLAAAAKEQDVAAAEQMAAAASEAGARVHDMSDAIGESGGVAKHLADMLNSAKASIGEYSKEAQAALESVISGVHSLNENIRAIDSLDASQFVNTDSLDTAKDKLGELTAALEATRERTAALDEAQHGAFQYFAGMDQQLEAISRFQERLIGAQIAAQKLALAEEEAGAALSDLQDAYDQGDLGLADYIDKLTRLRGQYGNLTDEQIPDLISALADAKAEMADFTASSKSDLQDLQGEWADLNNQKLYELDLEEQQRRAEIELDLLQAKKDKNTEAIAYLEQELGLLDQIYAKKKADQAAQDAEDKIKAAEDAAAEAERRANLTQEERNYEDKINALKAKLADAIAKADAQAQAAILAQIEAEKTRHQTYLDNLEKEKQKEKEKQDQQKAAADNVVAIGGGSKSTSADTGAGSTTQRTVEINLTGPDGSKATVNVLPGQEDTVEKFLRTLAAAKTTAQ